MMDLQQNEIDQNKELKTWHQAESSNACEEGEAEKSESITYKQSNQVLDPIFASMMNRQADFGPEGIQHSEVFLKKQFFRAARTNKTEVFQQTMDKMNGDLEFAWNVL